MSIVLHGEEGTSETRELIGHNPTTATTTTDTSQQLYNDVIFERNSRVTFLVTQPESLGAINRVQLWHNNAGASPGWFLSRVTIKDVNTSTAYYFNCCRWLAVERDDGRVEREFAAVETGLGFNQVPILTHIL